MRLEPALIAASIAISLAASANAVELKPSGRLHLDYASHNADVKAFDDRGLVRRAQFGVDAKFGDGWSGKVVYDFAAGGALKDAYLRYGGWKQAQITLGQSKVPFGLEQLESTNDLTLMERALPSNAFTLSRRKGVTFATDGPRHTFSVMAFGSSVGGNEGHGAAARLTFAPIDDKQDVVHLGVALTSERPSTDVSFSTRPESLPTDPKLVRTGTIPGVSRIDQIGLESAWKHGPLSLQGEWMGSRSQRDSGRPTASFEGWYVSGSWFITGESRLYHDGVFKSVSPDSKTGAWEVTARYSRINLDDGAIAGGRENNMTLGLNWYYNDHLRVMANVIDVHSRRAGLHDDPRIFALRAQVAF